jgi:signal transduction histidine kinase
LASNVIFAGLKLENLLPEIDVSTDPLLVRVFANMIDNTVRHGERATFIRFRSQVEDGTLQIICEDDGVGIQSEEKKKIFERGYGKNSGFGLFFAREILAITQSTIEENGEWGKGARFEIRVPSGKYRMMESASSE